MRPTLQYIIEKFDYFNKLCFDGQLQRPPIRLNTRYATMGMTRGEQRIDTNGHSYWTNLCIEISVRRDLPEYEYVDTLVHEMIHYYILSNNLVDDSPHGILFHKKMDEIIKKNGIRVTIAFDPTEEEMVNAITRYRYVCVVELNDGHTLFAVVARSKIFEFWELIPKIQGVEEVHWYVSNRQIFEKFPVAVSPKLMYVDADKIHHYLTGAVELENTGKTIRVRKHS